MKRNSFILLISLMVLIVGIICFKKVNEDKPPEFQIFFEQNKEKFQNIIAILESEYYPKDSSSVRIMFYDCNHYSKAYPKQKCDTGIANLMYELNLKEVSVEKESGCDGFYHFTKIYFYIVENSSDYHYYLYDYCQDAADVKEERWFSKVLSDKHWMYCIDYNH